MNLNQNKKLLRVLIASTGLFLILVFVIPIGINYFSKENKQEKVGGIVPPSKTTLPEPIEALKQAIIRSALKNTNGDLLLHETENYKIEYITAPNIFFVTIRNNTEDSRDESQKWFRDKGLKQEDLCDFSVRFRYIRKPGEKANFSSLPDGCTGEPLSK